MFYYVILRMGPGPVKRAGRHPARQKPGRPARREACAGSERPSRTPQAPRPQHWLARLRHDPASAVSPAPRTASRGAGWRASGTTKHNAGWRASGTTHRERGQRGSGWRCSSTRCRGTRSSPLTRSASWNAAGGGSSPRSGSSSPSRRRWSCSARRGSRWTATWSSSTPSSCWSRWPRRPASSTCRPATRRTTCTSAATTWCSAGSTAARSCARVRCAGTPPWTTSGGCPCWRSRSRSWIRRAA